MKDLMENWSRYLLTESSLSRIYQHITEHDTALLTAFRDDASDLSSCLETAVGAELSNKERNRDLKATLLSLGLERDISIFIMLLNLRADTCYYCSPKRY